MRHFIKGILPGPIKKWLKNKRKQISLISAYKYDYIRYNRYSASSGFTDKIRLESQIIKQYHVVEKGLTMPEPRLGFGVDNIILLSNNCLLFLSTYGLTPQVEHAISVIVEYYEFHKKCNFELSKFLQKKMDEILDVANKYNIIMANQVYISKEDFFQNSNSNFLEFSASRKSVRNYSEENIHIDTIKNVVELAQNTPSACNRQTSRVYIYDNKEQIKKIFEVQNGNRGFGHLTNKLIVIVAELGVFANPMERNQAFIDGGMYAMNMLYSLHHHKIAACILNCSNIPQVDRRMRKASGIKESEIFIAMIACGIPPVSFSIAASKRLISEDILTIIQ